MEGLKLLKKLIEKGWKPRGYEDVYEFKLYKLGYTFARPQKQKMISFATEIRYYIGGDYYTGYKGYSLRELVSKESGLWQFVCENGMVNNVGNFVYRRLRDGKKFGFDKPITHFTFRLIESSLKDESELEDFLLQNIKVDGE